MSNYPHLFSPIKIGGLHLPNRVIMGSMHTGHEEKSGGFNTLAKFYSERVKGGVGLIVTGGISPNRAGVTVIGGSRMTNLFHVAKHKKITESVHKEGGRILMQILHAGRYAYTPLAVGPSSIKAPINKFKPRKLSNWGVKRTIADFVRSARLAKRAGYDGVEIMGSEGYLINQFIAAETNKRTDQWGGSFENRIKFPLEIVKQTREAVGPDFVLMFRLSMLDLMKEGSDWAEITKLAKELEKAGVDVINTGIGWHEARIPTIATMVPRGAFSFVTQKLKSEVNVPLVATNRFNSPETCEEALSVGAADMISMARPFLADSHLMKKAKDGESDRINTCIGCNQACLDHLFERKTASCLVNPRACDEASWNDPDNPLRPNNKKAAVVGGGPAGMSCASELALLGYSVTLFERSKELGGQFNVAKKIPGKREFDETIRYFSKRLQELKVDVRLNTEASIEELSGNGYDHVILATGVTPRPLSIPGADRKEVVSYLDVLEGRVEVGEKVVIIGAGGIGFDVADYLSHDSDNTGFMESWGIDKDLNARGGLAKPNLKPSSRKIHILQRSKGKPGAKLGKTTGWIHRLTMKQRGVVAWGGVKYVEVNDEGLVIIHPEKGKLALPVDHVVVCAGQLTNAPLYEPLKTMGIDCHLIGGSKLASGLDAKRAIREGLELATKLYNNISS